jgi:hypothetical protein
MGRIDLFLAWAEAKGHVAAGPLPAAANGTFPHPAEIVLQSFPRTSHAPRYRLLLKQDRKPSFNRNLDPMRFVRHAGQKKWRREGYAKKNGPDANDRAIFRPDLAIPCRAARLQSQLRFTKQNQCS